MTAEEIKETADPEALCADGFDEAIIGTDIDGKVVYNINKMIEILMEEDDEMTESDAIEYLEFNTLFAYVGEMTPKYIYLQK
jgi:hypothetical protein